MLYSLFAANIYINKFEKRKDIKQTAMLLTISFEIRIPHPDNGRLLLVICLGFFFNFFLIPILQCTRKLFNIINVMNFNELYLVYTFSVLLYRVMLTYIINNNLCFLFRLFFFCALELGIIVLYTVEHPRCGAN